MITDTIQSPSALNKLHIEALDAAMRELGGRPFPPMMTLTRRREVLWHKITEQRALGLAKSPENRERFPIFNCPPKRLPRAIKYEDAAERMVFAAAQSGVAYSDLCNIVDAHYLGHGAWVDVQKQAQHLLARIATVYGWGVRQMQDSVVEVYS